MRGIIEAHQQAIEEACEMMALSAGVLKFEVIDITQHVGQHNNGDYYETSFSISNTDCSIPCHRG